MWNARKYVKDTQNIQILKILSTIVNIYVFGEIKHQPITTFPVFWTLLHMFKSVKKSPYTIPINNKIFNYSILIIQPLMYFGVNICVFVMMIWMGSIFWSVPKFYHNVIHFCALLPSLLLSYLGHKVDDTNEV